MRFICALVWRSSLYTSVLHHHIVLAESWSLAHQLGTNMWYNICDEIYLCTGWKIFIIYICAAPPYYAGWVLEPRTSAGNKYATNDWKEGMKTQYIPHMTRKQARWKVLDLAYNRCETRDKRPLGREPGRRWCHHHTSLKLFWSHRTMDSNQESFTAVCWSLTKDRLSWVSSWL